MSFDLRNYFIVFETSYWEYQIKIKEYILRKLYSSEIEILNDLLINSKEKFMPSKIFFSINLYVYFLISRFLLSRSFSKKDSRIGKLSVN